VPQLPTNSGRRDLAITAALVLAACALAALLAARAPLGIDYAGPVGTLCDCPATPIRALARGHLSDFFAGQPVMGSGSLILRAPFAAIGLHAGSGSDLELYRLGAFPCLLAAGLLAVFVLGRMRELRRPALACVLVPGLIAVNPLTARALKFGHPEEILAAALCVAAALAAGRRRPLLAGVLLGAAVATKQWALLAALPVLVAAPRGERLRLAAGAVAAGALLVVPMALGDPHRFSSGNHGAALIGPWTMPTNIWFPFGTDIPVVLGANGATTPPRSLPAILTQISHPLIVATGFVLALAWWRIRRDRQRDDVLVLLALIFLARCLLDPMTNSYYHLPFLMSLAAWEGLRRRGAPVLTVAATLAIGFTISLANGGLNLVGLNRFYLAWALPFAALLGLFAFRPATRIIALEGRSREEVLDGPTDPHGLHRALDTG
jgi:hypothetical protein